MTQEPFSQRNSVFASEMDVLVVEQDEPRCPVLDVGGICNCTQTKGSFREMKGKVNANGRKRVEGEKGQLALDVKSGFVTLLLA